MRATARADRGAPARAAALAASAAVLAIALAGSGTPARRAISTNALFKPTSTARYGGLPGWLPKAKLHVNRLVTASAARPALAIEGQPVSVALPRGRVLASAVGPETPEQGKFPVPATSPCTFIVTLSAAAGAVPIDPAAFTLVDEAGHVHRPHVSALHGGPPPAAATPGRPLSLKLYDVFPTGSGTLEWTPAGGRPVVSWDFDVEID
jgi:hypothetical protein